MTETFEEIVRSCETVASVVTREGGERVYDKTDLWKRPQVLSRERRREDRVVNNERGDSVEEVEVIEGRRKRRL